MTIKDAYKLLMLGLGTEEKYHHLCKQESLQLKSKHENQSTWSCYFSVITYFIYMPSCCDKIKKTSNKPGLYFICATIDDWPKLYSLLPDQIHRQGSCTEGHMGEKWGLGWVREHAHIHTWRQVEGEQMVVSTQWWSASDSIAAPVQHLKAV